MSGTHFSREGTGIDYMKDIKAMNHFIDDLVMRYPVLSESKKEIKDGAELLIKTVETGGKFLICGNGGSSADADHIVGELIKGF